MVICGADVVDVRGGVVRAADIRIEGGLIAELSSRGISAEGARVIDATGTTIIPGLIDCHVHVNAAAMIASPPLAASLAAAIAGDELRRMLLRGFTTVRDVAGADGGHREAVERSLFLGPRLFVAVDALSQTGGHGDSRGPGEVRPQDRPGLVVVDGADEVRRAVRDNLRRGADHIKLMVSGGISSPTDPLESIQFSEAEIRAATEEAANAGTYVAAHAYSDEAVCRAVEWGVRTIEHGSLIGERAAARMAAEGAIFVPTLSPYHWAMTEGEELGLARVPRREGAPSVRGVGGSGRARAGARREGRIRHRPLQDAARPPGVGARSARGVGVAARRPAERDARRRGGCRPRGQARRDRARRVCRPARCGGQSARGLDVPAGPGRADSADREGRRDRQERAQRDRKPGLRARSAERDRPRVRERRARPPGRGSRVRFRRRVQPRRRRLGGLPSLWRAAPVRRRSPRPPLLGGERHPARHRDDAGGDPRRAARGRSPPTAWSTASTCG